jgi:DNA-binding CsgD family transcriptional regulator
MHSSHNSERARLASIYRKLGAANRAQAVSIGIDNKLITN